MCNDRIWILLTRKLSGEATLTELKELELLLAADPQHHSTIEAISGVWHNQSSPDEDFMEATYLAHLERTKDKGLIINNEGLEPPDYQAASTHKANAFTRWASLVAIVAVVLMVGSFFLKSKQVSASKDVVAQKEIVTKNGNRTKVILPDGTDVWLNAGSNLQYAEAFEGNNREVYLTGEAFFDVTHNPDKPFIIHTKKMDVKVLGTQFNVKAYDGDKTTETSLIRGSVEVFLKSEPGKKYLLKPNQKLVLNTDAELASGRQEETAENTRKTPSLPKVAIKELSYFNESEIVESSWTKNVLSFDDEQFSEVAKKLERWYDVELVFKNKYWEKKHISGSFESESLEQALEALKYTTGFNYKINQHVITIF
jgi:transmembrane sensor